MPVPISPTVREILKLDLEQSADDVIRKAKAKGVTAPESSIRDAVHNIKSELRRKAAKGGATTAPKPKAAPAPAKVVTPKETDAESEVVAVAPAAAPVVPPALDLSAVLANVALVNAVVGVSGGVETARKVAEAVRSCGGVDAFLQHLELVAQVRGGTAV